MRTEDPPHIHSRCVACHGDAVTTEFVCSGCVRDFKKKREEVKVERNPFNPNCLSCRDMYRSSDNFRCTNCGGGFEKRETPYFYTKAKGVADPVNHPSHYTSHPSGVECIAITEHHGFCIGNAIKYLWRADMKGGLEDLKKARWYIEREIAKRDAK